MVVDSSIFLEIFSDGPARAVCEKHLRGKRIIVPTLVLFEIYKKLKAKVSEEDALSAVAALRAHQVADLTSEIALLAGDLSLEYSLPMADSLVLAHSRFQNEPLLTMDHDFLDIPEVIIVRK
jgi:predicted nucleic acid-binding protein